MTIGNSTLDCTADECTLISTKPNETGGSQRVCKHTVSVNSTSGENASNYVEDQNNRRYMLNLVRILLSSNAKQLYDQCTVDRQSISSHIRQGSVPLTFQQVETILKSDSSDISIQGDLPGGAWPLVLETVGNTERFALGYTDLTTEQIKELFEIVNSSKTLRELGLKGCGIENDGAAIIAEYLEENPALKALDLSDNSISDERDPSEFNGLYELQTALEKNKTLTKLDLSKNVIDDDNLNVINSFLERNKLQQLSEPSGPPQTAQAPSEPSVPPQPSPSEPSVPP